MTAPLQAKFSADHELRELILATENDARWVREITAVGRRSFLKLAGAAGGGLMIAFSLQPRTARANNAAEAGELTPKEFAPNAFLQVGTDGSVRIYSKGPEIGQGIKTSFAMIVAEELDADWEKVQVEQAPINPKVYGRQSAGGSRSVASAWTPLRRAGAAARTLLVAAAAQE